MSAHPTFSPAPSPFGAQSLLARAISDYSLSQAWDRVRSNDGSAGVDGESIAAFGEHLYANLQQLRAELEDGRYVPQPLRRVDIPKRSGGWRTLAIPVVRDRVLQTAVAQQLSLRLEPGFDDASYGYRPGRSVAQAVAQVVAWRDAGLQQVVDADIESFFDHLDHPRLLALLRQRVPDAGLCALVSLWLAQAPAGEASAACGVAQGSPLSPLLANLYLDELDQRMRQNQLALVRYADDFVLLCTQPDQAALALTLVQTVVADLRLHLNERKTRLTSFAQGFEFLGVRFEQDRVEPVRDAAAPATTPSLPPEPGTPRILEPLDPALNLDDAAAPSASPVSDDVALESRAPLLQSLYVAEPGCWLTREHDRVVVSLKHEVRASVPLGQLDQIAVMENAMLSTSLLLHCAQRHVSVAVGRPGEGVVTLDGGHWLDQQTLRAQWAAQERPDLGLWLARRMVEGKLHNASTVLRRFARHGSTDAEALAPHLRSISDCAHRLPQADHLPALRGLEGAAARAYFAAPRALLPPEAGFAARHRQPPTDPINACLSLGYAVLAHNLHTLVRLEGLNAHLGHLHASGPGSLALVCDLMEEFRAPVVDAVVLTLWRSGQLQAEHFVHSSAPDEPPCRLDSAARRRLIGALEAKLESRLAHPRLQRLMDYRRAMQAQVRHYLRVLLGDEPLYQPLKLR